MEMPVRPLAAALADGDSAWPLARHMMVPRILALLVAKAPAREALAPRPHPLRDVLDVLDVLDEARIGDRLPVGLHGPSRVHPW